MATLVGRTAELAVLRAGIDAAVAGTGTLTIVQGPPGIGKTRLLDEVAAYATARHCAVRRATAYRIERDRPFGLVKSALGISDDPDTDLPGATTATHRAAGDVTLDDRRYVIADALADRLEKLSTGGPVLLCLDDVHWADPSSLLVLHGLAPRIGSMPIAVVLGRRHLPEPEALADFERRLDALGARRLAVAPLTPDEVVELTTALSDRNGTAPPDRRLLAEVRRAGGNPLLIGELVAAWTAPDRPGDAGADAYRVPTPSVADAVLRRLADVSTGAHDLLTTAAVLGTTFRADELAAITGRTVPDLLGALSELVGTGLIHDHADGLRFRHDLVHGAIYGSIPPDIRRSLHRHTADVLAERGADDTRVAEQVARGAQAGDSQALAWLRRAARQAIGQDPRVAAHLLDRARRIAGPEHPDRVPLLLELLDARIYGGQFDLAHTLADQLLADSAGLTPDDDLAVRRQLILLDDQSGHHDRSLDRIEALLGDPRVAADPVLQAGLAAQRAFHLAWADPDSVGDDIKRALAVADSHDDPALTVWSHIAAASYHTVRGFLREGAEHARAAGAHVDRLTAQTGRGAPAMAVAHLLMADEFDEVETRLRHRMWTAAREASGWAPVRHSWRSNLAYWRGDWDAALAEAETALAVARETGSQFAVNTAREVLGTTLLRRGRLAEAREHTAGRTDELPITAALLAEATGRIAGLRKFLRAEVLPAIGETFFLLEAREQGYHWVRLLLATGERAAAESVAAAADTVADRAGVASATGQALLCRGVLADDPELLVRAAAELRDTPRRVLLADCLAAAGATLVRRDPAGTDAAIDALTEAAQLYDGFGAAHDLRRVDALLRSAGVARSGSGARPTAKHGWASLTPTELAIAEHVEQNLIYQEIADLLFISRRTVETHVAHIFAKLGIASRRQLAELVRANRANAADQAGGGPV